MESRTLDLRSYVQDKQSQILSGTKPSITFRSAGRDTVPHWSNRFRKDFNDLQYDIKYNLIKGKDDIKHKSKYQKNLRDSHRSNKSKSINSSPQKQSRINSSDKYRNRVQMIKMNKINNPQRFAIPQNKKYSTLDTQGLCKFEFQKTINGRLVYKSNNHLQFNNQTQRSTNLNPVYYKRQDQLNTNKMFNKSANYSHEFTSYTPRRVFIPREQLDKFYDTAKSFRLTSAKTIRQTCKIDGIIGRKNDRLPQGSGLSYNQYQSKKKLMQKICTYTINNQKRQLQFTRQVISPQRGCYR